MNGQSVSTFVLLIVTGLLSAKAATIIADDDNTVSKRSVGWFGSAKPEETIVAPIPDALAGGVWKVHRYNGLELNPIGQHYAPELENPIEQHYAPEPVPLPPIVEPLLDDHRIEAINDFIAAIPEERLNILDAGTIGPYLNLIPEHSLDTLQVALKSHGIKEKSKLKKLIGLLKYLKHLKFKPVHYIKDKLLGKFKPNRPHHGLHLPHLPVPSLPAYADFQQLPEPHSLLPQLHSQSPYFQHPVKFVGAESYISVHKPKPIVTTHAIEHPIHIPSPHYGYPHHSYPYDISAAASSNEPVYSNPPPVGYQPYERLPQPSSSSSDNEYQEILYTSASENRQEADSKSPIVNYNKATEVTIVTPISNSDDVINVRQSIPRIEDTAANQQNRYPAAAAENQIDHSQRNVFLPTVPKTAIYAYPSAINNESK